MRFFFSINQAHIFKSDWINLSHHLLIFLGKKDVYLQSLVMLGLLPIGDDHHSNRMTTPLLSIYCLLKYTKKMAYLRTKQMVYIQSAFVNRTKWTKQTQ